jgi:nucleoside-diphosphate-sugar epimerase
MRIAVTGVSGEVGGFVARELRSAGHDAVGVDLREPEGLELSAFHRADIEDLPALTAAFAGCEAVVHLAALREPGLAADDVVFRLNTMGTFNALEAAVARGVRRLVLASSEAVLGFSFCTQPVIPEYFPIDEGHALLPQDPYGLSKLVGEELCAAYSRRGAISTICLRTSYVFAMEWAEDAIDALTDPMRGQRGLWSYVHARDAAVAYRLACEVEGFEHASLFIVGPDARTAVPSDELLARFYPDTPQRTPLSGTDPIISGAEAARVLGFTPAHSWRDDVGAEAAS